MALRSTAGYETVCNEPLSGGAGRNRFCRGWVDGLEANPVHSTLWHVDRHETLFTHGPETIIDREALRAVCVSNVSLFDIRLPCRR